MFGKLFIYYSVSEFYLHVFELVVESEILMENITEKYFQVSIGLNLHVCELMVNLHVFKSIFQVFKLPLDAYMI